MTVNHRTGTATALRSASVPHNKQVRLHVSALGYTECLGMIEAAVGLQTMIVAMIDLIGLQTDWALQGVTEAFTGKATLASAEAPMHLKEHGCSERMDFLKSRMLWLPGESHTPEINSLLGTSEAGILPSEISQCVMVPSEICHPETHATHYRQPLLLQHL